MDLLIQGMRRSGTTILYDLLLEEGGWDAYYEPLAEDKVTVGGGSNAHRFDLFSSVRAARSEFARTHSGYDVSALNHGAPRDPRLELERELPEPVRAYLRQLLSNAPRTLIKFTRMWRKVGVLAELAPDALFVHVVRDPRAVTSSYLLGRGRRNLGRLRNEDAFFGRRSSRSSWSSFPLSELLLKEPAYWRFAGCTDIGRVLLLWKVAFEETRAQGQASFGDRYRLVRHEDVVRAPKEVLATLYAALGRQVPASAEAWARANVREPQGPHAAEDSRWGALFEEFDLGAALQTAGYAPA